MERFTSILLRPGNSTAKCTWRFSAAASPSAVRAGENEGRVLHHEFIVLALQSVPLKNGAADLALPVPAVAGVTRHALAVWISRRGDSIPIQATGGWLD